MGRTQDNLDDAIVVISKENEAQFDQTRMGAVLSPNFVDEGEIQQLRDLGDSYMVDGLEQLYSMTESSELVKIIHLLKQIAISLSLYMLNILLP